MTRKTPGTNVKAIVPTADELDKARAKREAMTGEQKRAVKASVRHFFGLNAEENEKLADGAVDDATIDKWLTWLDRCDDSSKTVESERTFKKGSQKFTDLSWYSKETPKEFGEHRAAYWLSTGLLPERGDRITGKRGQWITEYGVPNDWQRLTEEDWRNLKKKTEFELNKDNAEEETATFEAMGKALTNDASSSAGASSTDKLIVKQEPSAGDVMAEKKKIESTEGPGADAHENLKHGSSADVCPS